MYNKFIDKERADFLAARITDKRGLLPAWPRPEKELATVDLEVDWVRYSTLNHRTRAEQKREIAKTGQQKLFTEDPLGPVAQAAQYKILRDQSGFNDLKDDLADRGQQEYAIVTAEGILINGNRRAAALRSLLQDDTNLDCRYVRCLVLPVDSTPQELLELETELQIAKDFKQDYSWVNEALLIEELYERNGRDFITVAKKMHRKNKDIQDNYEKIQQVNQLVALSGGKWLHIDFEPNESAFNELAQYIRNKPDKEKEAVRTVYFLGTLAGVNYRDLRHLRCDDAEDLVAQELQGAVELADIVSMAKTKHGKSSAEPDLLDDVLGEPSKSGPVLPVLELVAGFDKDSPVELPSGAEIELSDVYQELDRVITKASEEAAERKRDVDVLSAPVTRLSKAITELTRANEALAAARAINGWDEPAFLAKVDIAQTCLDSLKEST